MPSSDFARFSRLKLLNAASVQTYIGAILAATCAAGYIAAFVSLGGWFSEVAQSAEASLNSSQETKAYEGAVFRPETVVKPISCTQLPHVEGKSVTTALVEFPPNAVTAAHRHPGSVTAYVIKGAVRSQMEGGAAVVYRAGEGWFEAPGELHLLAENASPVELAEILAVFVADNDCGSLVIPELD